jgi:NitT/TauT family transport system ATP-binding protein
MMVSMLLLKDITKVYPGGVGALGGISLFVEEGEFVCLLGPSGCGKSTLLHIVAGLETADAGEVSVRGEQVAGPHRSAGVIFQDYALFPWLSVGKNVSFGPSVRGMKKEQYKKDVEDWISLVGLEAFVDKYPGQLSGGMKQRAAIARALANDPDLLLMDEPLAALDEQLRESLQLEVLRIWTQTQKTVLYVTHSVLEAVFLASRVVVLGKRPGKVLAELPIDLPRPRTQQMRVSSHFHELEAQVRSIMVEAADA